MGFKVAVVGATGNVGREILDIMCERNFPADEVVALASSRSVGREVAYGDDKRLKCQDLAEYDFKGTDIVLSSPGASVSKIYAPKAAEAGAVVVDNTSYFRMEPDIPLVIPEVNPQAIAGYKKRGIIANPNCSTIQMLVALKPLHEAFKIKRVVVSTYQSVSGGGKDAMDELFNQTKGIFTNQPVHETQKKFTKQIAFNVIPHIDVFMDDGATKEEWKMVVETKKSSIPISRCTPTAPRCRFSSVTPSTSTSKPQNRLMRKRPAACCVRPTVFRWSITGPTKATSPRSRAPVKMRPMSAAFAAITPWPTVCPSGAFRTTCAKGRRSTRSKSPKCWLRTI